MFLIVANDDDFSLVTSDLELPATTLDHDDDYTEDSATQAVPLSLHALSDDQVVLTFCTTG